MGTVERHVNAARLKAELECETPLSSERGGAAAEAEWLQFGGSVAMGSISTRSVR